MQIFVKGLSGRTIPVDVAPEMTVEALCASVGEDATVFFAGRVLEDEMTLAAANVQESSTLTFAVPLEGGKGKKKKKRVFTKPKKNAHRHKNVPLRVLKFYKISGDGDDVKVEHVLTECPHPSCGAGVFMANHKTRHTCGKCSLTFVTAKK